MYVLVTYTPSQAYLLYQNNIMCLFLDLTRSNFGSYLVNAIAPTKRAIIDINNKNCIILQGFDKYKMYHPDLQ